MTLFGKVHINRGWFLERRIATVFVLRGYAEKEGWPDMAKGRVLSRIPKWVPVAYLPGVHCKI